MYSDTVYTKFSNNWNGRMILCDVFTDVRDYDPEKYCIGSLHNILYKDKCIGTAEVVAVREMVFRDIRSMLSHIVSGHPAHYLAGFINRIYAPQGTRLTPDKALMHVAWKWKERDFSLQQHMLQEWWKDVTNTQTS